MAVFEQEVTEGEIRNLFGEYRLDINIYTFDSLIDAVLPLARYKAYIAQQFTGKPLPNAEFSINDIIVDTLIRRLTSSSSGTFSTSDNVEKFANYVQEWLGTSSDQHLALLGDYGQGKSTAALELTYKLLHEPEMWKKFGKRIPVLIRLTGLSPKTTTPEDLFGAWRTSMGFSGRALLALHKAGRTLLIFDAFDEMANVSDRADRLDHFGALWRFACDGAKILFTGRPNFFLDNEELKRVLGISELNSSGPYCTAIRIEPFSMEQIKGSLRRLPEPTANRLLDIISEQQRLREIATRPSLLFQLSQLWEGNRLDLENADVHSALIIKKFVTYSIERQIRKQYNDISFSTADRTFIRLRESELTYFTAGCAAASLSDDRNNSLSETVFRKTISDMWEKLGEEDRFSRKPSEEGSLTMPLRERFADEDDPIAVCEQIVRTHGVIELDPTRRAVYRFSHKSFSEAVSAVVIASGAVGDRGEWAEAWKATRPLKLLNQFIIFQFCHDCAQSYARDGVRLAEHKVFCNITFSQDNLASRVFYYYRKLILSVQMPLFRQKVLKLEKMEGSAESARVRAVGVLKTALLELMSARRMMQLLPITGGMIVAVYLASGTSTELETDSGWWTILLVGSVVLSTVGYLGLFSAINRRLSLLFLFCNMFVRSDIAGVDDGRTDEGLGGALRLVLNNPRAFAIYSQDL